MSPDAFEELRALVNEVLELSSAERVRFLEQLSKTNPERAAEVGRLLQHETKSAAILRTGGAQKALDF